MSKEKLQFTKQSLLFLGLLVLSVTVLSLLVFSYVTTPKVTKEAPLRSALTPLSEEAQFTDLNGEVLPLEKSFGSYIIVYSWASWCPQCATDLVKLDTFAAILAEDDTVEIYAINRAEDKYAAERYLNTLPELTNLQIVLDPTDQLFKSVAGFAMPETLVFDRTGAVAYRARGELDTNKLQEELQNLRN